MECTCSLGLQKEALEHSAPIPLFHGSFLWLLSDCWLCVCTGSDLDSYSLACVATQYLFGWLYTHHQAMETTYQFQRCAASSLRFVFVLIVR